MTMPPPLRILPLPPPRVIGAMHREGRGVLRSGALAVPFVAIRGEIDDAMAKRIRTELDAYPEAKEIAVTIDSVGGFLRPAQEIYNALRQHGGRISIRVIGLCCSAASLLLLAGDYREGSQKATFLLHGSEATPPNSDRRWTAEVHVQQAAALRETNSRMAKFYSDKTGRSEKLFLKEMGNERPMTADRALEIGLIHQIIGKSW